MRIPLRTLARTMTTGTQVGEIRLPRRPVAECLVGSQGVCRKELTSTAMAAEDCGPRVQELSNQIRDLRAREVELKEAVDARRQFEVTDELLDHAAREIEVALLNGSAAQKKALLRQLIHEIPTDGRRAYPKYRVPVQEVRIVGTLVECQPLRAQYPPPETAGST